jgi:hypothetical protein
MSAISQLLVRAYDRKDPMAKEEVRKLNLLYNPFLQKLY